MTRFFSSVVIFFVVIFGILSPKFFIILGAALSALMAYEWFKMCKKNLKINFLGLFVSSIPVASLMIISQFDQARWLLFSYFMVLWTSDSMSMIGGKIIKGPPLAPFISPNKTISGFFVGLISSGIMVYLISFIPSYQLPYMFDENKFTLVLIGMLGSISATLGDLFESYFKRKFNVKDTSSMIPGHGGFLDRFDSIIISSPILLMYLVINI